MPDFPESLGVRPDPIPDPKLPTIRKSYSCTLNDGTEKTYPTLGDYLDHYIELGLVKDLDDLVQNYAQFIGEIFINWVMTGQLGCLFAVKLARKPRENRWHTVIQLDALSAPSKTPEIVNAHLDAAAANHEAAIIIFPDIVSAEQIKDLINALCLDPTGRWYTTDEGIDPHPEDALEYIGLRWILPSDKSVNYVLGFSAIESMPRTRQSPFTALFLRVRDEKRTDPDLEDGRVQVHLADLDSTLPSQLAHNAMLESTKLHRSNHVEIHMTTAARARITFSIPKHLGAGLCKKRRVVRQKANST